MLKKDLIEKRKELEAKRAKLAKVFEESRDGKDLDFMKASGLKGETMKDRVEEVRKANLELTDLADEVKSLAGALEAEKTVKGLKDGVTPVEHEEKGGKVKTAGDLIIESGAIDAFQKGIRKDFELPINLKTLFQTSAGWAPEPLRTGRVVEAATRPIQLIDLIPPGNTNDSAIVYMEETTFTNAAAETAEGGSAPEGALALTEKSSPVRKINVFIPVTEEQLADEAQARTYLENRLRFMIMQRLDGQIVLGDGSAPNLTGILNQSGIQTYALTSEPVPDAIYKAITKVEVTGKAIPNGVVLHPNDWQGIRLLRTSDGIYIWGNPSEAAPERIWGLPVIKAQAETENTGIVGDFANFIQLVEKAGLTINISDSHSDYFIKGQLAVKATIRVALPIYRPAAFCTVTGI